MPMKKSAGILLFRRINHSVEFLLVHPGGPYFKNKDAGSWTIPKGEFDDTEDALVAAIREFREETGQEISGNFIELTPVKQKAGKMVFAWALEGDIVAETINSNTFEMEWPPKSGNKQSFAEVDKAQWFFTDDAKQKINSSQAALIDELINNLKEKN
jgi:predicted NUDIX family NTP pyrophosphohydrolase